MFRCLNDKRGFTLIELIIYIAVFAFVLVLISETIIVTLHTRDHIKARTEVQQNLRFATEKISLACRKATGVNSPGANSSGPTLTLTTGDGDTVFSVEDEVLKMSGQDLTTNKVKVSSITFYQVKNPEAKPTVQVDITIEYISGGNPHLVASTSSQTTIALR